jgi:hypothetical protein
MDFNKLRRTFTRVVNGMDKIKRSLTIIFLINKLKTVSSRALLVVNKLSLVQRSVDGYQQVENYVL